LGSFRIALFNLNERNKISRTKERRMDDNSEERGTIAYSFTQEMARLMEEGDDFMTALEKFKEKCPKCFVRAYFPDGSVAGLVKGGFYVKKKNPFDFMF